MGPVAAEKFLHLFPRPLILLFAFDFDHSPIEGRFGAFKKYVGKAASGQADGKHQVRVRDPLHTLLLAMPLDDALDDASQQFTLPFGYGSIVTRELFFKRICFPQHMLFHGIVQTFEEVLYGAPEENGAGNDDVGAWTRLRSFDARNEAPTFSDQEDG